MSVDPIVQQAVNQAVAPTPRKLLPLIRMLLFHIYFVPSALALLPFNLIRSIFPFLRKDARWTFLQNLSVVHVRRVIRLYCRFRVQPLQPREHGWRESNSALGTFLAFINYSGPGGRVVHPKEALHAAQHIAGSGRTDRVWLDPPPLDAFRGILTIRTGKPGEGIAHGPSYNGPPLVDPGFAKVRTRAFWFMHSDHVSPPHPSDRKVRDRPVILFFHGGAGVTFSAGDLFMGETLAGNLARTTGIDVFSVDYLLAPEAKFPGSIVQALAGWFYLTRHLGYKPSQIIIGGDSYGGELTLSLTRYLLTDFPEYEGYDAESAAAARDGEKPAALLLLSPYCDARAGSGNVPPCYARNHKKDIVALPYGDWGHAARGLFYGKEAKTLTHALHKEDPWFTFASLRPEEIKRYPPMFIANGGNELLYDMGCELAHLAKINGVPVHHHIDDAAVHDYFTLHTFLPESRLAYTEFKKWWSSLQRVQAHSHL